MNFKGVEVNGAGMWHSVLHEDVPHTSSWKNYHHFDLDDNSVLRGVTVDQNAVSRESAGASDYALMSVGDGWLIERVWIQHGTNWLSGSNGTIKDCRVSGSWGDGINLNNGNAYSPKKLGLNLTASNNFVRGADDDNFATFSDSGVGGASPLMDGTSLVNNISAACFASNGLRVAGGKNILVQNNLVHSCVANNGIRLGAYGTSGHPIESATVSANVIHRSGGMVVGSTAANSNFPTAYTNAYIKDNVITDSFLMGLHIGGVHQNLVITNDVIENPKQLGIMISKGVVGTGTFEHNSVSGYTTGGVYNGAKTTFTPTTSANSW